MKRIGKQVFEASALKDIYYAGSKNDWWRIDIEQNNPSLPGVTIHYGRDEVEVTEVKLWDTTEHLTVGGTMSLAFSVFPADATDKRVTWKSSDPSIVTVDTNGKITAVKAGAATVTATSSNGKSASCEVTVSDPVVSVTKVELSTNRLSLFTGETATLTVTFIPANAAGSGAFWESSNESVAEVDSTGKVTALKAGTTWIRATSYNGKSAVCKVTVSDSVVEVTGVTLSKTALSLTTGKSESLAAAVAPVNVTDQSLQWTSSDERVATVDQAGRVTAVKAGNATITVKSSNGKSTSCTVTVTDPIVAVTGITLSSSSLSLNAGRSSTLRAVVAPANATNRKVTWTSSDPSIASVDSEGKVKALAMGRAVIMAKTADGGKTASCRVSVFFDDVQEGRYYYDPVKWAVENGITSGVSKTSFGPDQTCTRAQIVTFLWKSAGSPKVSGTMQFTDVKPKSYYYSAVLWAVQKGITSGKTKTGFAPNDPCTRGQIVSFLWRYKESPKVSASGTFTDVPAKAYYTDAVNWAVQNKVTAGKTQTTFGPGDPCTRAHAVTFLYRAK